MVMVMARTLNCFPATKLSVFSANYFTFAKAALDFYAIDCYDFIFRVGFSLLFAGSGQAASYRKMVSYAVN